MRVGLLFDLHLSPKDNSFEVLEYVISSSDIKKYVIGGDVGNFLALRDRFSTPEELERAKKELQKGNPGPKTECNEKVKLSDPIVKRYFVF